TPNDRRDPGAGDDPGITPGAPLRGVDLRAPLQAHDAHDQPQEDKEQWQVEAAKHVRIPGRERREERTTRGDEPDLVAVPDGPDGADHGATAGLVAAQEGQEQPHPEAEALQHEVAREQEDDEAKPQGRQVDTHDSFPSAPRAKLTVPAGCICFSSSSSVVSDATASGPDSAGGPSRTTRRISQNHTTARMP